MRARALFAARTDFTSERAGTQIRRDTPSAYLARCRAVSYIYIYGRRGISGQTPRVYKYFYKFSIVPLIEQKCRAARDLWYIYMYVRENVHTSRARDKRHPVARLYPRILCASCNAAGHRQRFCKQADREASRRRRDVSAGVTVTSLKSVVTSRAGSATHEGPSQP